MEDYNQKSWLSRNWPWALPVGCCSGCLVIVLIMVFGMGVAVFSVFDEISDMSPTTEIVNNAKTNPKIIELIGEDIQSTGFPSGNISMQNDSGDVDFSIGVIGSKGEGTLYARGIRANEKWIYEELYVIIKETGEQINLLENEKVLDEI